MSDRTVHASGGFGEVVRYDRAAKWYLELPGPWKARMHLTVEEAAWCAAQTNYTWHEGLPGGGRFDILVRREKGTR